MTKIRQFGQKMTTGSTWLQPQQEGFALTRRYAVTPLVKKNRSSGLEVLKGRELT
jgi:hypothetical protein